MTAEEDFLREIRRLNATVRFAFARQLQTELEKVASTPDRRRIWAVIDGELTTKDISRQLGIPRRTVDFFLSLAEECGLLQNPRGRPPVKLVDYVPLEWKGSGKIEMKQ